VDRRGTFSFNVPSGGAFADASAAKSFIDQQIGSRNQ
jgi:hypothetical protein